MNKASLLACEMPHNLDTERSVLGSILINNSSLNIALEVKLQSEDFFHNSHQRIYEAIIDLSKRNCPLDLITLTEELKNRNVYDSMGGFNFLSEFFEPAFKLGNLAAYIEIIQSKATLRRIIQLGSEMVSEAMGSISNVEDYLDEVESRVFAISDKKITKSSATLKDIFLTNLQLIEETAIKKSDVIGLKTGFRDLDRLTGGLNPGQLIILAARPGMGKTSLFLNICKNVVTHDPKAVVGVFSLEMTKEELGLRLLSSSARIPSDRLKNGRLTSTEWNNLSSLSRDLSDSKIEINDASELTSLEIKAACRRILAREKRLDLIVIDYLQLMKGTKASQKGEATREREVSEISRSLKSLAKELKVPIIALSQLNRSLEARTNKRPLLSDLRESGSIEADADIVLFIHREDKYNPETDDTGLAELIVAKHRAGATATVKLKWIAEHTLFLDLEPVQVRKPAMSVVTN